MPTDYRRRQAISMQPLPPDIAGTYHSLRFGHCVPQIPIRGRCTIVKVYLGCKAGRSYSPTGCYAKGGTQRHSVEGEAASPPGKSSLSGTMTVGLKKLIMWRI